MLAHRAKAKRVRDPEGTRERLLQAGFQEVYRSGFQSAGIDTILAATNVTKGARIVIASAALFVTALGAEAEAAEANRAISPPAGRSAGICSTNDTVPAFRMAPPVGRVAEHDPEVNVPRGRRGGPAVVGRRARVGPLPPDPIQVELAVRIAAADPSRAETGTAPWAAVPVTGPSPRWGAVAAACTRRWAISSATL